MDAFISGAFMALVITAIFGLGDVLLRFRYTTTGFVVTFITSVITFFTLVLVNYLILYFVRPPITGPMHGYIWTAFPMLVALIIFVVSNSLLAGSEGGMGNFSLFPIVVTLGLISLGCFWWRETLFVPFGGGEAKQLAGLVKVIEMGPEDYPDTDPNHIVTVSEENATFKANQVIAKETDAKGRNLGSIYNVGKPEIQSINGHLYWVSDLEFGGWRLWMQVDQVAPGYILVDAEDPTVDPQLRLGFKMKCTPSAFLGSKLQRFLYSHGYSSYNVDGITIEIDDEFKPWYTASLNRPLVHTSGNVPVAMIVADPETCEVTRYPLNQIPEWVDRVYSQATVTKIMNWWGEWNSAPWKILWGHTPAGRTKVAIDPIPVYTRSGHPHWQVIMTSQQDDSSIVSIVLFDGRSNIARLYPVLSGTPVEEAVLKAFRSTKETVKHFEPKHLSMHKIYGEPTWVVSYVPPVDAQDGVPGEPFQGIGLLNAKDVDGANVIFAPTLRRALDLYRQFLARGSFKDEAEENRTTQSIEGTIAAITQQTIDGNTDYLILLKGDSERVYKALAEKSVELAFAKAGDRVVIQFFDVGLNPVDIVGFNDLDLPIVP
ncbi:MAG: hypothetical protein A2806_01675 [Candidatus Terrybacteria bacterium RIFCSPHIGHO2_01_FULL_48_17]|uniref:Uncharacterized protein n=1 Tax=Candidatus Terrybacteria bacterium RIFCSPHIGHO2_01_FULL_48_17 TaxID=1802362 RepID=A0A1G2PL98_9BACT|nr:MAG: hypothetical protein A2806_01675 [Candidatus Terrybacteria bacterium RIFCSPHIGHO2_01_FULL_48_17]